MGFGRPFRAVFCLGLASVALAGATTVTANEEWTRQFGARGSTDVVRAITADETGVYVSGTVSVALPGQTYFGGLGDAFLRKYDHAGNEVWTRQFGSSGDDFTAGGPVALDDSGVYVAGWTTGAFPGYVNAGLYDIFVSKFDHDGNELWTRQVGSEDLDNVGGMVAGRGGLYVAGVIQTNDRSAHGYVLHYDHDGNEVWRREAVGASTDFHAVAMDRSGVYAGGSVSPLPDFAGDIDGLVVKYGFDGTPLWVRQFGALGSDEHVGGIAVKHGKVYVTGHMTGTFPGETSAGGRDAFVGSFDAAGDHLWTRQFGGSGADGATLMGIAADGSGVYLTSTVAGTLPGETSAGALDMYLRGYTADGRVMLSRQFGTARSDFPQAVSVTDTAIYISGRAGAALPGQPDAENQAAFVMKFSKGD